VNNIFTIIIRFFPLIVFFLLEIFSVYIYVNNNSYLKSNFLNKSNSVVASYYSKVNNTKNYFNLVEVNDGLSQSNGEYMKRILELEALNNTHIEDSIAKSVAPSENYSLTPAHVIFNSIANNKNYIIIDKGSRHGIEKNLGVINNNGPVGVVIQVSENYSCIVSVLNKESNIGARIQNSKYFGILRWDAKDYRLAKLEEIPKHVTVHKGDLIETSGYSTFFPEGLKIGKVIGKKNNPENNFSTITVELDNDFAHLNYVYVLKMKQQKEIAEFSTFIESKQNQSKADE